MSAERIEEIIGDAASEVYDGNLDFGHVGTGDFIEWLDHIKEIGGYPIRDFDLLSTMRVFEEQVIASEACKAVAEFRAKSPILPLQEPRGDLGAPKSTVDSGNGGAE